MLAPDAAQHALMYFLVPLWLAAGLADWFCHKRTDIEHTTGPQESLIHLLMLAEVGLPLLAALFLEINAAIIGFFIVAFLVHEATAFWDVSYAVSGRQVAPIEQHIHSFLEILPLTAICIISMGNPGQFLALFGQGAESPRWNLSLKTDAMPGPYLVALVCGILVCSIWPYLNELWRGWRAKH